MKGRILSGIQPTGSLHLGNYLGAIQQWVAMQHEYQCCFMLADLHAITVPQDPKALRESIYNTTATYIACGIDPKKSVIFPQSAVHQHAELAWVLNCHTPLGWLDRMTQFKEKAKIKDANISKDIQAHLAEINSQQKLLETGMVKGFEQVGQAISSFVSFVKKILAQQYEASNAKLGLYAYPVLMAADILLYKATHVPVGEDQKQHLELARDIAGAFNRAYDTEFFPLPEPVIQSAATRVMSLKDGTKKMSKSDPSELSRIHLTDDADSIAKKIKKAKSDMEEGLTYEPEKRPEAANLLRIFSALSGRKVSDVAADYATSGFAPFKRDLADLAVDKLAPIADEANRLMGDRGELNRILKDGAERATAITAPVMRDVKELVGLFG